MYNGQLLQTCQTTIGDVTYTTFQKQAEIMQQTEMINDPGQQQQTQASMITTLNNLPTLQKQQINYGYVWELPPYNSMLKKVIAGL